MEREELAAWLRLSLTPGVGDAMARKLLAAFGLPADIFSQRTAALSQVASAAQVQALTRPPENFDVQLEVTWRWLQAADAGAARHIAVLGDPSYPPSLLVTEDPPVLLYMLGRVDLAQAQIARSVAIVGSRNPTPQGEANARQFARALSDAGLAVVSGLALGVDGAAHEGALAGPGADGFATVAVVGTGLDRVYPARHRDLAHRITQRGLIVSEFPLGTPPLQHNFPKRNRIIAGLSLATLVVEAALKSGSLITARMAVEQGKDVLAIPGSIHSPQSRGCHALIRQGAKLVESAEDVLEELRLPGAAPQRARAIDGATQGDNLFADDEGDAGEADPSGDRSLLAQLGHDPVSIDALSARTGLGIAALQSQLLELELDGHVARLPGGLFQRVSTV